MDSIPQDKPHYAYTLAYPDDYPDIMKASAVFYVGKGIGKRIDEHEREAKRGVRSHKCSVIRKILANGGQVVKEKVAQFETHKEACMMEIALIFLMKPYGHLINHTDGGDGISGYNHTPQAKRKISEASKARPITEEMRRKVSMSLKGHKHSEESRRKISEAGMGRPSPMKGKTHTAETRQKLSIAGKGRVPPNKGKPGKPHTEECKQHMSEVMKGRPRSEEYRRNISNAQKGRKASLEALQNMTEANRRIAEKRRGLPGKPHSEEARRKIGEAGKGRTPPNKGVPMSEEQKRKVSEGRKGIGKGQKQAPEIIQKRVEKLRGKKRSGAALANIQAAQKRRRERERSQIAQMTEPLFEEFGT